MNCVVDPRVWTVGQAAVVSPRTRRSDDGDMTTTQRRSRPGWPWAALRGDRTLSEPASGSGRPPRTAEEAGADRVGRDVCDTARYV